jgi:hypothetical protein
MFFNMRIGTRSNTELKHSQRNGIKKKSNFENRHSIMAKALPLLQSGALARTTDRGKNQFFRRLLVAPQAMIENNYFSPYSA